MHKRFNLNFFVLITSLFSLCACGQNNESKKTSYDGREFDISLEEDGSLICKSVKDGFNYSLAISGSGASKDYEKKELVPWNPIVKKINAVTINEGITNIGDYYFYSIPLNHFILPSTVSSVGSHSFNKSSIIFTFGSELTNIENDVYYYSETKPTTSGKYFYMEDGEPVVWPDLPSRALSFLFIGNSFTYRGDSGTTDNPEVPNDFKKLATNFDIDVDIDYVCEGSYSLTSFADPSDKLGKIVEQKLTTNQYDYVILQEQSTTPINNYQTFLTAVKKLKARIDNTQDDCQTILYETWGTPYNTKKDSTTYGATPGEMEAKIRSAYTSVGQETGCKVNYIGKAFTYAYETEKINIYDDDERHQNGLGAYLSAACHLRSIFLIKVSNCSEFCGLSQNECKALLSVADKVI